jgi:hypothetical protein
LSLALHCGLPVVVPDIGAFPERVSQRALSAVMPWNLSLPDWRLFWQEVLASEGLPAHYLCTETHGTDVAPDTNFYRDGYLQAVVVTQGELKQETLDSLANNYHLVQSGLSRSERLLRSIWRFSRSPIVAKCVALVPFRLKQSFKRRLSSRPMHDIVYKE